MNTTRIVVEAALVLGTTGILLELIHFHTWWILLICIVVLTWLHVRRLCP